MDFGAKAFEFLDGQASMLQDVPDGCRLAVGEAVLGGENIPAEK